MHQLYEFWTEKSYSSTLQSGIDVGPGKFGKKNKQNLQTYDENIIVCLV